VTLSTVSHLQFLRNLHDALVAEFWPIWVALTVAVALCTAWTVARADAARGRGRRETPKDLAATWRGAAKPAGIAALAVLAVFLASYVALNLAWENFADYDNSFLTLGTLQGHDIAPPIWPQQGRFWPLGLQEFNLIRHFTDTASGYHVLPIVQLLIFVYILIILDKELAIAARVALAILALSVPSILLGFDVLIVPERNELFFLACLVLSLRRFEETEAIAWALAAVVCGQFMVYYKETAFLLLLGLAAGRLLLRRCSGRHAKWAHDLVRDRQSRLDLGLLAVALLYLLYYFAAMGLHHNINYAYARRQPFVEILLAYIRLDLLAWLLVAVAMGRIYLILRRQTAPQPLWDGLALGGVLCFLAYLYLHMFNLNYLAPVDLVAVLYVGHFALVSLESSRSWRRAAIITCIIVVVLQAFLLSAVVTFERKNNIHAKLEIARVVQEQYRVRGGDKPLRLFFPYANPYVIMEFAAYLNHRGIPVEGAESPGAAAEKIILATPSIASNGPCVDYRTISCRAASEAAPGDLVIVLPDDGASRAEASAYQAGGKRLLSYEPRPAAPWLRSLFGELAGCVRAPSPIFPHKQVPDRWMDASVTLWK
jgi:hypothetical protein